MVGWWGWWWWRGRPIRHCRHCLARLPPVHRVMKAGLIFTDTLPFQSPVGVVGGRGGVDTDTLPVGEGAGEGETEAGLVGSLQWIRLNWSQRKSVHVLGK